MGVKNNLFILYFEIIYVYITYYISIYITFGRDKSFLISILAKGEEIPRLGPQERKEIIKIDLFFKIHWIPFWRTSFSWVYDSSSL